MRVKPQRVARPVQKRLQNSGVTGQKFLFIICLCIYLLWNRTKSTDIFVYQTCTVSKKDTVEPQVISQKTILVGYLTISTNVSSYQTRCRRKYHLPFSNTARVYASAHGARNTVQQLLCRTLNSFLLSYGANRPELNSIDYTRYMESTAAWIWVVSVQIWKNQAATGWTLAKQ